MDYCQLNNVAIIEEALRQFPYITTLKEVNIIVVDRLPNNDDAQIDYHTKTVKVAQKICFKSQDYKEYVFAHEIGHLIGKYNDGVIHNEQLADLYASRIYLRDKRSLLVWFEEQCSQGYYNQCTTWRNWEWAIVH